MTEKALIKAGDIDPLEIFVTGKYQTILDAIKEKATIENPDTSTAKGRALIKTMAAKVAGSKVLLEEFGKKLSDKKRAQIKTDLDAIQAARNAIKDFCVELKETVRKPLTEWETEKREREAKEALEIKIRADWKEALEMDVIFNEKKELAVERARLDQEAADRKKEDEIRKKLEKEKDAEKLAILQREAEAKAETKRLEQKGIDDRNQAKIDQEKAVLIAKHDAEKEAAQKERERKEREAEEKRIKDEKAADHEHQKQVNNQSLSDLVTAGHSEEVAKKVIIAIIQGKIRNVTINY